MREIIISSIRPVCRHELGKTVEEYLEYIGSYLDDAAERGSDIACLPEFFADQDGDAEVVPGPISRYVMQKAKMGKMYVIAPIVEKLQDQKFNSAMLIDRNGEITGKYHKVHPIAMETEQMGISRGETIPVFDTDFGPMGIMTCFDGFFPEMAAIMARKQAKVIFYPHRENTPNPSAYELHVRARAMDNSVYVVTATCGIKRGEACNPTVCYPTYIAGLDGEIIASLGPEEGILTVTVDVDRKWFVCGHGEEGAHDVRRILSKYRRPEIYRKEDVP